MKKLVLLLCTCLVTLGACDEAGNIDLGDFGEGLSDEHIIAGLKEALEFGADTAVTKLNVDNGYFGDQLVKIFLPEEAQPVYDVLSQVPLLDGLVDDAILSINRAAEDAAVEAKPIFVEAITNMTIGDGLDILHGEDTAATSFLRSNTYAGLYVAFQPKIEASLSKPLVAGVSAESAYGSMINAYNSASFNGFLWDKITTNSLSEHTTNRALRGLFIKVGEQEKDIRENPFERVTELMQEVFALQDEDGA